MSSIYRITQDRINEAMNELHDGNYSNPTVVIQSIWGESKDNTTEALWRSFKELMIIHQ